MQKQLLFTVIDALEAVTNDIDIMTSISTEFGDIVQEYQLLEARIKQLKDKITAISDNEDIDVIDTLTIANAFAESEFTAIIHLPQ